MTATKVNLSQMVDLAVGTPEVGAVNFNVLHTLLHAMLRRLNIVDFQADLNDFDRDFLLASKARELPVLSDVDSGQIDNAEDAITISERSSSMPTLSTGRTPYHLEGKVTKMKEQLENITSFPSNKYLFEKTRTQYEEKPICEMWLNMKLKSQVETNEKGIAKCMSMIEDMTKENHGLINEQKKQMDQIKGFNIDDLTKRLNAMEKSMNEMNDKFNTLPSPDDFAKFVTVPELEDALQGIRKDLESKLPTPHDFAQFVTWERLENAIQGIELDWENLRQPTERVVVKMSSQTDDGSDPVQPTEKDVIKMLSPTTDDVTHHLSSDLTSSSKSYFISQPTERDVIKMSSQATDDGSDPVQPTEKDVIKMSSQTTDDGSDPVQPTEKDVIKMSSQATDDGSDPVQPTERDVIKMSSQVTDDGSDPVQPTEKDVIKMSSQTTDDGSDPVPSRPTSSRSVTDGASSDSPGPSEALLEILKKLGKVGESQEALTKQFEELEVEIAKKEDQDPLDELNVSLELLELKKQVDAQAAARENISEPSMALELLAPSSAPRSVTSNEQLLLQHEKEMQALSITNLQSKVSMLEDQLSLIQDMIKDNSARWESKHGTEFEEEIGDICDQNEPDETRDQADVVNDQLHDICNQSEPDKTRNLSDVVNDQLHDIRDEELKESLERTKSAEFRDTYLDALLTAQNANREEFKRLFAYCDELQMNKADKTEVDVKGDKRTSDDEVSQSLFDTKTNDINKMIKEILEETWNQQCKVYSDDIDGKLDRSELDPLKEWLLSRLDALNDKLMTQNQAPVDWVDNAAGIRKQLIQKYNCISCDRPIDIIPTEPGELPRTRSPRLPLIHETDQIRQQVKSDTSTGVRTVAERPKAKICKFDKKAFQVHFGNDGEDFQKQKNTSNDCPNADYYATNRSCGGQHTTAYPYKRLGNRIHISNVIIKEDELTNVHPLHNYRVEINVKGADGNIYKGRRDCLEPILPTRDSSSMQRRDKSTPQPMRPKVMQIARPSSAEMLHSPSPPPRNGSHPQSPHQTVSLQAMAGSSSPTPCQSPLPQEIISVEQA